jgi:hypothetical protein
MNGPDATQEEIDAKFRAGCAARWDDANQLSKPLGALWPPMPLLDRAIRLSQTEIPDN